VGGGRKEIPRVEHSWPMIQARPVVDDARFHLKKLLKKVINSPEVDCGKGEEALRGKKK